MNRYFFFLQTLKALFVGTLMLPLAACGLIENHQHTSAASDSKIDGQDNKGGNIGKTIFPTPLPTPTGSNDKTSYSEQVLSVMGGMYLSDAEGYFPAATSPSLYPDEVRYFDAKGNELPSIKHAASIELWFTYLDQDPGRTGPDHIAAYLIEDVPPTEKLNQNELSKRGTKVILSPATKGGDSQGTVFYRGVFPASSLRSGNADNEESFFLNEKSSTELTLVPLSLLAQSLPNYFQYFSLLSQPPDNQTTALAPPEARQCQAPPEGYSKLGLTSQCFPTWDQFRLISSFADPELINHNIDNGVYSIFLFYNPDAIVAEIAALSESGTKITTDPIDANDQRLIDPDDPVSLCSDYIPYTYKETYLVDNIGAANVTVYNNTEFKMTKALRCDYVCASCDSTSEAAASSSNLRYIGHFQGESAVSSFDLKVSTNVSTAPDWEQAATLPGLGVKLEVKRGEEKLEYSPRWEMLRCRSFRDRPIQVSVEPSTFVSGFDWLPAYGSKTWCSPQYETRRIQISPDHYGCTYELQPKYALRDSPHNTIHHNYFTTDQRFTPEAGDPPTYHIRFLERVDHVTGVFHYLTLGPFNINEAYSTPLPDWAVQPYYDYHYAGVKFSYADDWQSIALAIGAQRHSYGITLLGRAQSCQTQKFDKFGNPICDSYELWP